MDAHFNIYFTNHTYDHDKTIHGEFKENMRILTVLFVKEVWCAGNSMAVKTRRDMSTVKMRQVCFNSLVFLTMNKRALGEIMIASRHL